MAQLMPVFAAFIVAIFMGVIETFSSISSSDCYSFFIDSYFESKKSISEIIIHVYPIILILVYYLLLILILIWSYCIDFLLELGIISEILLEWGSEARKLLVYIKKKIENNYYILLYFWITLPVIYLFSSVLKIVDYNLFLLILSPILIIWLLLTHYFSDSFHLNDFKEVIKGKEVTIKGLKNINIDLIYFFVKVFLGLLLLSLIIGIPLYLNGHLELIIKNIWNTRKNILPLIIFSGLFYKLIKIRNRHGIIVFLNSLSTLLAFTIEFNTLSGLYSFYSKQEGVASLNLYDNLKKFIKDSKQEGVASLNLYDNLKKFIKDLIDYNGLNFKHRIPVCTRLPRGELGTPKLVGKSPSAVSREIPVRVPYVTNSVYQLEKIFNSPVSVAILSSDIIRFQETGKISRSLNVVGDLMLKSGYLPMRIQNPGFIIGEVECSDWDSETVVGSECGNESTVAGSEIGSNNIFGSVKECAEYQRDYASVKSKNLDPQLSFCPEFYAENRVQTVLVNTDQAAPSIDCNSDSSKIISSDKGSIQIDENLTINKPGSRGWYIKLMSIITPKEDIIIDHFSRFLWERMQDNNLSSSHREFLGKIRLKRFEYENFESFLLSHKLNFVSFFDETPSEFCYWIMDYQAFLEYLNLKDITIENMDQITYIYYNNYRLFIHFFLPRYDYMDLLRYKEVDKETLKVKFSEFTEYPTNKLILKQLPIILVELYHLKNVIKIYFPLIKGGWVPTEFETNQLNKLNLKWSYPISCIHFEPRVDLSAFLNYPSVAKFMSCLNFSGSLRELLSNEEACTELDSLLNDLGNKLGEYNKEFNDRPDLPNILHRIQNNILESLRISELLFLWDNKLELEAHSELLSSATKLSPYPLVEGIQLENLLSDAAPSPPGGITNEIEGRQEENLLSDAAPSPPGGITNEIEGIQQENLLSDAAPSPPGGITNEIDGSASLNNSLNEITAPVGSSLPGVPIPSLDGIIEGCIAEDYQDNSLPKSPAQAGYNRQSRVIIDQGLRPDQPSRADLDSRRGEINNENPEGVRKKRKFNRGGAKRRAMLDDNFLDIYGHDHNNPQPSLDPVRDPTSSNGAAAQPAKEVPARLPPFDPVKDAALSYGAAAQPQPAPHAAALVVPLYEPVLAPEPVRGSYIVPEGYYESHVDIAKRIIKDLPSKAKPNERYDNDATIDQLLPSCVNCLSSWDRSYLNEFIKINYQYIYTSIVYENSVDKSIVIDYSKMSYRHYWKIRQDLLSHIRKFG